MPQPLPPGPISAAGMPDPPPLDSHSSPPGPRPRTLRRAARRPARALRWAVRAGRQLAGWMGRVARAAWTLARLSEPLPPTPLQEPVEGGVLASARWYRGARPAWQRAGFVGMLALLLAMLLGPAEVLVAELALLVAWSIWALVGRLGRVVIGGLAVWLCWALLGRNAIPVLGLAVFTRWFLTSQSTGLLPHARMARRDRAVDQAGNGDVHATVPLHPNGHGRPAQDDHGQSVLTSPDPSLVGHVRSSWPAAVQAAGLTGAVLRDVRPILFGWTATIELRPGQTLDDAVRQQGALESALDAPPGAVRLEQDPIRRRRVRLRVLERDPHAQPVRFAGPTAGSIRRPIALGLSELGEPTAPLLAGYHTLLVGTTGSGKSMLLNVAVAELVAAADAVVWGIDFTGGAELGPWELHGCLGRVATTPQQAEHLLLAAVAVLEARLAELARRGIRTWPTGPDAPELKIVIDEHAEVVRTCSPAALHAIDSIAERGRKVAVTVVVASLRASMDVLGSDTLRAMLKVRVCLGVEDPGELPLALGLGRGERAKWPAELLDAPGKFFIRSREQGLVAARVHRGFEFADAQVTRVAAHLSGRPTSLGELSDRAAAQYPSPTQPSPPPGPAVPLGDHSPDAPLLGSEWAAPGPPGGPSARAAGRLGWAAGGRTGDPDVALLLDVLAKAGPAGLTVPELEQAIGRRKTWLYDRLAELVHAGTVDRLRQGRHRLRHLPLIDLPPPP